MSQLMQMIPGMSNLMPAGGIWCPHVPTMYRWDPRGRCFFGGQVQKRRASRESSGLWPGTWDRVGFQ